MEAALRETRIKDLRTKIAECQQEFAELAGKSSTLPLPPEEMTEISRRQEETLRQCDYLQYMLGLYEYQGECDEV
jgi:hypothetical protein